MQLQPIQIGLLGVSFNTSNLGVLALSESSIKAILTHCPNAQIRLLGTKAPVPAYDIQVNRRDLHLEVWPISFSKNIFATNHFLVLSFYAFMIRLFPAKKLCHYLRRRNPYLKAFMEADIIMDITGGDSFSDIYGVRRFALDFCRKWLVLQLGKPLILLPQTYGPFQRRWARILARYILKRAHRIYARDSISKEVAEVTRGSKPSGNSKISIIPDVAFLLDKQRPKTTEVEYIENRLRQEGRISVGINVSGLLYNGGYTRKNEFGLQTDYQELMRRIIEYFMTEKNVQVLFIPHLFDERTNNVESDSFACKRMYEAFRDRYNDRVHLLGGVYNHKEIKYFIGLTDFFLGSRMHSCIAALSQCIPAVGLAYSRKFHGVYTTLKMERLIIDLTNKIYEEVMQAIKDNYSQRSRITCHLKNTIPKTQNQIISAFSDLY